MAVPSNQEELAIPLELVNSDPDERKVKVTDNEFKRANAPDLIHTPIVIIETEGIALVDSGANISFIS